MDSILELEPERNSGQRRLRIVGSLLARSNLKRRRAFILQSNRDISIFRPSSNRTGAECARPRGRYRRFLAVPRYQLSTP